MCRIVNGTAVFRAVRILKRQTGKRDGLIRAAGEVQDPDPVGPVSDFARGRIGCDRVAAVNGDFARTVNGQGDGRGDGDLAAQCDGRDAVRKGDLAAGSVIGIHKPVDCVHDCFPQRDHAVEGIEDIVRGIHGQGRCFRFQCVCTGIEREHGLDTAHCIPFGVFVLRCGEDFAISQTVIRLIRLEIQCYRVICCLDPFLRRSIQIVEIGSDFSGQRTGNGGRSGSGDGKHAVCARSGCRRSENFFRCGIYGIEVFGLVHMSVVSEAGK